MVLTFEETELFLKTGNMDHIISGINNTSKMIKTSLILDLKVINIWRTHQSYQ